MALFASGRWHYFWLAGRSARSDFYVAHCSSILHIRLFTLPRDKQQLMRTQGRYVGIGVASRHEKSVLSATELWMLNRTPGFALTSSPESASIKIDATGKAVISLLAPTCGNSPETVAAMVLAEQLGMDPADISVTYSDSDHGLPGTGPAGSRYTVMITGAVTGAAKIIKEKLKRVASHMSKPGRTILNFATGRSASKAPPAWKSRSPRWRPRRISSGCHCPTIRI